MKTGTVQGGTHQEERKKAGTHQYPTQERNAMNKMHQEGGNKAVTQKKLREHGTQREEHRRTREERIRGTHQGTTHQEVTQKGRTHQGSKVNRPFKLLTELQ